MYNNYGNGFSPSYSSYNRIEVPRVMGMNGAQSYNLPPNSSILLLDNNDPIVWLVKTDSAGYKEITPYSITPYQPAPAPDFNSLEMRIKALEDVINGKSDSGTA